MTTTHDARLARVPVRRSRIAGLVAAGALLPGALAPPAASAHGIAEREDLPVPQWLFAWGAAVVLVASFVALGVLWPKPRLEQARARLIAAVPVVAQLLCGAVGVGLFALTVYAGLAGAQNATVNLAPTMVFVVFWVGVPFATVLVGDLWGAFNPWRATARAVAWAATRAGARAPSPLPYPGRAGHWPAAAGILAFAWVELVYVDRDQPSQLAILALAYAGVQLVGMSLYGIEPWTRHADAFSVYFRLFSLLSPFDWTRRRLGVRPALAGATTLVPVAGTVALVGVMLGSTTFDGFANGPVWSEVEPHLQSAFEHAGLGQRAALEAAFTIGLLVAIAVVAGLYLAGVAGMRSVGRRRRRTGELARRFVHTLIPIALAYVVAHYFSLLAFQGQAVGYLASDPLGHGTNLLGTARWGIDYSVVGANGIWYVQVAALVLGHVAGLTLAHDRALVVYDRVRDATRSQYWMLAVMVAFTSLGLWLLSAQ